MRMVQLSMFAFRKLEHSSSTEGSGAVAFATLSANCFRSVSTVFFAARTRGSESEIRLIRDLRNNNLELITSRCVAPLGLKNLQQ